MGERRVPTSGAERSLGLHLDVLRAREPDQRRLSAPTRVFYDAIMISYRITAYIAIIDVYSAIEVSLDDATRKALLRR
jgi:hypothetical protein